MYKSQLNIFSWNKDSEGATVLAEALGIKKIKHERSLYEGSDKKTVINWGSSELPPKILRSKILNHPDKVKLCTNKRMFFEFLADSHIKVSVPDWTTSQEVALKWVADGYIVCARTVLAGHSAVGLVLMNKDEIKSLVKAPLYTKYVPKRDEFRVHVFNNGVIDVQKKALRDGWAEDHNGVVNFKIRNLANGFIYMRNDIVVPETVIDEAKKAVKAIGLDFGAVDVIYNEKKSLGYVLEINSAPGIEGTTIDNYVNAFKTLLKR